MARNLVEYVKEISAKKQLWAEEKPKLDNARRLIVVETSIRKTRNSMKP